MPRVARFFLFLFLSAACLITSAYFLIDQIAGFNASRALLPPGTVIAGIPAGGMTAQEAALRVEQAYVRTPVELRIGQSAVQISPPAAGQQLDFEVMFSNSPAGLASNYWQQFWDYLWQRVPSGGLSELTCEVDQATLRAHLHELLDNRYDQPPRAGGPLAPGDVRFISGAPGTVIDVESATPRIRAALCSREARVVELEVREIAAAPPSAESLELALHALVQASGFDGVIEVYAQSLTGGEEVRFAYARRAQIPPEIAFTAASTIKIPVMVSAYRQIDGALPDSLRRQMELMIDLSENSSTDVVMQQALDPNIAPVQVTDDMRALGLENTFLAGFFYPGAPLLNRYQTPANQRGDVNTDPDIYNQTTAADMGRLLAAIQRCAGGAGPLLDAYRQQVSQAECQEMTALLEKNRKGLLIETGLPEGTRMGHKYGFVTDVTDGLMHTASDAAIVYSPGGDFVLAIYLYHSDQLHWDPSQRLVALLATATYNYHNTGRD